MDSLNSAMPTKAEKKDLLDLEDRLTKQLKDAMDELLGTLANKEDIMKRLAQLGKNMNDLMEMMAKLKRDGIHEEDDAMFTKKHLGPVSCASCERGLVNLSGMPADFHTYKKLPFRDPSERIARYGQGFSKILSHMRPSDLIGGTPPLRASAGRGSARERVPRRETDIGLGPPPPLYYTHKKLSL